MRRKIVAGNWKMNKDKEAADVLVDEIIDNLTKVDQEVELILFPPFVYIQNISSKTTNVTISVGAQNVSSEIKGAYTGEVSASMLQSVGAEYVLIGHSERREYFNEENEVLTKKVERAFEEGLNVIFCCGETLSERKSETHFARIEEQISTVLFELSEELMAKIIIAYEPVWAIGTGETASSSQAQEMHAFIRSLIAKKFNTNLAEQIPLLYGGSCKPENAFELFSMVDIDGGLIGGASLVSNDFLAIASSFN